MRLAASRFSSEASWPAWAGGCAAGLRTWARHDDDLGFASCPLRAGSATACGGALAPCNGSDLLTLRLRFAHQPAVRFVTSPALWKFFTPPAERSWSSRSDAPFVPPFGVFPSAVLDEGSARAILPRWYTVAAMYPLGNCDSPGPETSPDYLTRLGAVSHRTSTHGSMIRVSAGARTPAVEPVNPASFPRTLRRRLRRGRANQPAPAFPQSPGIIPGMLWRSCDHPAHSGSFKELGSR